MASFNKIIIVGNLGRDPELTYTPQGTAVCKLSVATSEKRKDRNGEQSESVTWFRASVWGRQAEVVAEHFTKGKPIYLEGRLRQEEYIDREGNKRQSLEVNVTDFQFVGGSKSDSSERTEAAMDAQAPPKAASKPKAPASPADVDWEPPF
jgi:single-strand DNA-binding protein